MAMAVLVTLWAARLALHIGVRNAGKPEDVRYQGLRARWQPFWWKSLFVVFLLQGALLLVVAAPIGIAARGPDLVALALFGFGLVVESVADLQLALFKRDPHNAGRVMDRGLWAWSRHPNYFGEMLLWWGLGLLALSAPYGPLALIGPATITFLLLRVSGVPMLEATVKQRRPGYVDYVARTPAFWPRPPRR
jgi:steroid 5-alpha reductase family enzyme